MSDLLGIQPATTPENSAIRLHPSDNVAIARVPLDPGAMIFVGGLRVTVRAFIPAGHKLTFGDIPAGANLIRYGCSIGIATTAIQPGEHVHLHNLAFLPAAQLTAPPQEERPLRRVAEHIPTFLG